MENSETRKEQKKKSSNVSWKGFLRKKRLLAERLRKLPEPSPKSEEWKYTNPEKIDFNFLRQKGLFDNKLQDPFSSKLLERMEKNASYVFDVASGEGSREPDRGISVLRLTHDSPPAPGNPLVKKFTSLAFSCIEETSDYASAFTAAYARSSLFISLNKDIEPERPLLIKAGDRLPANSHIVVLVRKGVSASIVEACFSSIPHYSSLVEVFLEENASLDYYAVQASSRNSNLILTRLALLGRNSSLRWRVANFGGAFYRSRTDTLFDGTGSESEHASLFVASGTQEAFVMANARHNVENTSNNIVNKGVVSGKSRSTFRGNISISGNAQKTSSFLRDDTIILSGEGVANTIPALEIDANDVRASHGSTISKIDEDMLYYLMSRGIPRKSAEHLIVEGFLNPLIDKFKIKWVRDETKRAAGFFLKQPFSDCEIKRKSFK